jgi:hypothetical protein
MALLARDRLIGLPEGATAMGRFSVDVMLANNDDVTAVRNGTLGAAQIHKTTVAAVIDMGAARLVLPERIAAELGLRFKGMSRVRYADQHTAERQVVDGVWLEVNGRDGVFKAVLEPDRTDALLRAIVLEDLDYIVDCIGEQLLPRDPTTILTEVE